MPLINCSSCNKEISHFAVTCPHCGAPTEYGIETAKKEKRKKRGNVQGAGCLMIVLAVILGVTVVGLPFAVILCIAGLAVLVYGFFV